MTAKRSAITFAMALFCFTASAEAERIYGFWRSSSGNKFEIPRGREGSFDLIMKAPSGKLSLMRGAWVEGMEGTQFTYGTGGAVNTGTFSNDDPHRIRVVPARGKATFWKRDRRRSRAAMWAGTWKSTSGNVFTVAARRGGPFNIIRTSPKGRKAVIVARWVEGMEGTQFEYGKPAVTVTYNPEARGRLRVVDSAGKVFWWSGM